MSLEATNRAEKKGFSRRKFLFRGGIILGGTAIGLAFAKNPGRRALAHYLETGEQFSFLTTKKPSFWFEVNPQNKVILKSAKVEMGQGIFTGFAMIAAEELNIPPEEISVISHYTKTDVNDVLGTNGSSSTLVMFEPIRKVAALFREIFTHTAAKIWACEPNQILNQNATLQWQDQQLTYTELQELDVDLVIPKQPKLKPVEDFIYVGKELKRIDLIEKIKGEAKFAIDHHIAGMLFAQMVFCPILDGKIVRINKEKAIQNPNVIDVVWEDDLIAVVAKTRYAAIQGRKMLEIAYEQSRTWQQSDVEDIVQHPQCKAVLVQKKGDIRIFDNTEPKRIIRSAYSTPIGVHGQIEPNGLIADVKEDHAEIFIGYQWTYYMQHQLAKALGMRRRDIHIQNHFIGGGFGRKFFMANAVNTALLSQKFKKPVCAFWEREDEFQHGYFRPNSHHVFSAILTDQNELESLRHEAAIADMTFHHLPFPSVKAILGSDMLSSGHGIRIFYDAKNIQGYHYDVKVPYHAGIWRSVGMFPNNFAQESFIDELAHHANMDPVLFRLHHLTSSKLRIKRLKHILTLTVEKSEWFKQKKHSKGWGIAIGEDRNTVVAAAVKIAIENERIVVKRIIHSIDPGLIINPEGVRMQVEGASIMALSAALFEETIIENNRFKANNFDGYQIARMEDCPNIEVHLHAGLDKPFGAGEAAMCTVAPAIANAVFDLTGIRLRSIPLQKAYTKAIS